MPHFTVNHPSQSTRRSRTRPLRRGELRRRSGPLREPVLGLEAYPHQHHHDRDLDEHADDRGERRGKCGHSTIPFSELHQGMDCCGRGAWPCRRHASVSRPGASALLPAAGSAAASDPEGGAHRIDSGKQDSRGQRPQTDDGQGWLRSPFRTISLKRAVTASRIRRASSAGSR